MPLDFKTNVAGDDIDKLLENEMNTSRSRHRPRNEKRSRSRNRHRRRRRSRSKSFDEEEWKNRKKRELIDRDDCSIFACHIHPAVDEKDIFEFFSQCGEVRDILLMRDSKSGTSKGYGYIEFREKEAVVSALTINGQYLGGSPIMVSASNAEKNRAAVSATSTAVAEGPFKLYVSNIAEEIGAKDLEPIFGAFGTVEGIYVEKKVDKATGTKSGFVEFRNHPEALLALNHINNMSILNKKLRISQKNLSGGANHLGGAIPGLNPSLLDEGQGGLQLNANSRVMLMQRLQASAQEKEEKNTGSVTAGNVSLPVQKKVHSRYVLLKNMFDPQEETSPDWEAEIEEDVRTECSKFGVVESCIVDKNSLGHVYLIFKEATGAKDAVNQLNGRWFSQKQIVADMIEFEVYQRMCPKSA